jgi:hypothetical protein
MKEGQVSNGPPVPQPPTSDPLDAHVAEYAALTNRMTYWITLQYVIYASAAASLGLFVKDFLPELGLTQSWALLLLLLFFSWAILQTQDEIVSTAVYLEELRPKVVSLLRGDQAKHEASVWRWETFLNSVRGKGMADFDRKNGLAPPFALGITTAIGFVAYRILREEHPFQFWFVSKNLLWFVACAYIAVMAAGRWRRNSVLYERLDKLASPSKAP